ncbi:MAG: hypothetical protein PWQ67_864 [Clostridia bacterium]|jgi:hypothetical protein|nr:hypothetical protein [Clostridia bacterium]MDN5322410.1 hypothetical protein [Clostridia bacterium]
MADKVAGVDGLFGSFFTNPFFVNLLQVIIIYFLLMWLFGFPFGYAY